jgi:hypothetical protein
MATIPDWVVGVTLLLSGLQWARFLGRVWVPEVLMRKRKIKLVPTDSVTGYGVQFIEPHEDGCDVIRRV